MTQNISVADFLEEDRDEVRFEDGEFLFPEKEVKDPNTYDNYQKNNLSGLEKGLASAYASTVTGTFALTQEGLKTVYKGLRFLAMR